MSDVIRELRNEINALKEINGELERKNAELMEKIDKLMEENETLKSEKSQENSTESTIAIPSSQLMKRTQEEDSNSLASNNKTEKFLAKRFVPNWLIEVLAWIKRKEMANSSLSTSSETFKQLCWPKLHLSVKPRKIPFLELFPVCYEFGNVRTLVRRLDKEIIPIASIKSPEYIVGFEKIELKFVNEQVVNFFKSIAHLLQNCKFEMANIFLKIDKKQFASIHDLLECLAEKIIKFEFYNGIELTCLKQFFPGIFDKVQFLCFWSYTLYIDEIDIILDLLTKNRKHMIMEFRHPECVFLVNFINRIKEDFTNSNLSAIFLINHIKEDFTNSNSPTLFLIHIFSGLDLEMEEMEDIEYFMLENEQTNEILTFNENIRGFDLARYPKEGKHLKENMENKIQQIQNSTITSINLKDILQE